MSANDRIETGLKVFSALFASIAFLGGVVQYGITRREEFRRHFWDEQFALYQDAASSAAEIAIAPHIDSTTTARKRFWILYWGKLSMVEHPEVERAMVRFGFKLSRCEAGTDTDCFVQAPGSQLTELRQHAFNLAHCAQFSLSKTWQPLELYPESKCPMELRTPPE